MLITAAEAAKELLIHDNIMLISHMSPDGDSLGGAFALYYALIKIGKRVKIRCSDDLPVRFSYLYCDYIDNDFKEEYVVAVDVAAVQLFGERMSEYCEKTDLCIDHHPTNEMYAKNTFLNHHAAATCEMVYEVINIMAIPMTQTIANCLYTGIATDSGCFKYSNTTANTHIVAARLFELGAEYEEINRFLFDTKSKSRMAIEQKILSTVEYFMHDKVAMIFITQKMINEINADESELDGLSALPRTIEGVEIGLTVREKVDGKHKVSVRTSGDVNAGELCGIFGGGGHKRAAGCLLECDLETAKARLLTAIEPLLQQ